MNSAPPTPITPRTAWDALRFRVEVRGQRIEVDMRPTATTYRLLEGSGLMIEHFGETVRLRPGVPALMPCLAPHEAEEALEPDVAA
jgi:trehalose/maltose hydrolase-like predicted phosphorylase